MSDPQEVSGNAPSSSSGGDQEQIRLYAVVPKTWCEHLEDNVKPVPHSGIDAHSTCSTCDSATENWICLHCYLTCCSRYVNGDMQRHTDEEGHKLALSLADLSVWCFACDSYVNNQITLQAKESAYRSKFGAPFRGAAVTPDAIAEEDEDDVER